MQALNLLALLLLSTNAGAEVIKQCNDGKGRLTYTNQDCPPGTYEIPVKVKPVITDSHELRDWATKNPEWLNTAKNKATDYKAGIRPQAPQPQTPFRDPIACENAKRSYIFEVSFRYGKQALVAAKAKEVYRDCGYWP